MNINFWLNGVNRHAEISPDTLLIDFLRKQGCFSVKRGCETANCGLCTVLMDGRPVLSCSTLAARIEGKKRSHRGADQRISCGKSVQMFRFCFPDKEYPEVPEI